MRSPAVVRASGNHLVGAASVYLQEHAHNPVDWYPWGAEALARAKSEGKPVFLSIGYSACHWCHVMEGEVFENDEVAAFLNEHFVSIKVDREERPDLDEAYMRALQAMSGSGGWPMTLFLTPALQPFFGATYLPKERFLLVARKAWEEASSDGGATGDAAEVQRRIARAEGGGTAPPIPASDLRTIALAALDRVDSELGGFRGQMKFPLPVEWTFLLHALRKWGDAPIETALRGALDAMAAGGIRDPIGGGFHRYSTDPRWQVPHFEKMLYDNAELASLYLEAGAALGEPRYTAVATDTLDFLLREMQGEGGGFYASFDADSAGREGAYYVWSARELHAVLGDGDGDVATRLLGASDAGPFDGASAVNRQASVADVAAKSGSSVAAVDVAWARSRPRLLAARASRPHPRPDTKLVTAWNGLAIVALAQGFVATGDARYRDGAMRAADVMWRRNRRAAGGMVRASNGDAVSAAAVLDDYACLARGFIALYEATGDRTSVERALTLVSEANARFAAPGGGWYEAEDGATPFARALSLDDNVEPSGASALLHDEIALFALTLRPELDRSAGETLAFRADAVRQRGMGAAGWLDAALLRAGPYYDVVLASDGAGGAAIDAAWRAVDPPWAVLARVPAGGADAALAKLVASASDKNAGSTPARAFVCAEGACKLPTSDPSVLRAQLLEGWKR